MTTWLEATDEAAMQLFSRQIDGPITMLNLLRFRDTADYSAFPDLDPGATISGREAYQRYIEHTLPYLHATGGALDLLGNAGHFFVGPPDEVWDAAMLVRQNSLQDFLAFATNEAYLAGVGHRTAALIDSRILPIEVLPDHNLLTT